MSVSTRAQDQHNEFLGVTIDKTCKNIIKDVNSYIITLDLEI